jgi:hypothetical protein
MRLQHSESTPSNALMTVNKVHRVVGQNSDSQDRCGTGHCRNPLSADEKATKIFPLIVNARRASSAADLPFNGHAAEGNEGRTVGFRSALLEPYRRSVS